MALHSWVYGNADSGNWRYYDANWQDYVSVVDGGKVARQVRQLTGVRTDSGSHAGTAYLSQQQPVTSGDFACGCWVKRVGYFSGYINEIYWGGGGQLRWRFYPDGKVRILTRSSTYNYNESQFVESPVDDSWHHYLWFWDSAAKKFQFYFDGGLRKTIQFSADENYLQYPGAHSKFGLGWFWEITPDTKIYIDNYRFAYGDNCLAEAMPRAVELLEVV